jgi:hypothetical protein
MGRQRGGVGEEAGQASRRLVAAVAPEGSSMSSTVFLAFSISGFASEFGQFLQVTAAGPHGPHCPTLPPQSLASLQHCATFLCSCVCLSPCATRSLKAEVKSSFYVWLLSLCLLHNGSLI